MRTVAIAVLVYGLLSGQPCQIDTRELVFRHATVTGFTLYHWLEQTGTIGKLSALRAVQRRLGDALRTDVRKRVPLAGEEIAQRADRGGFVVFSEVAEVAESAEGGEQQRGVLRLQVGDLRSERVGDRGQAP